ncbi:MAG: hypothetical protein ING77_16375, partial [Rhodocyclaceae bacterium]|nr:hypothetical protein [Rhodocyclaceae bacterium]
MEHSTHVAAATTGAGDRLDAWLDGDRARERRLLLRVAALVALVAGSFWLTGLFDL